MGILNKILFWRHDDEFDFDKIADQQLKTGIKDDPLMEMDQQMDFEERPSLEPEFRRPGGARASPYKQTNFQQSTSQASDNMQKDLELISSKLDTIKAILSSLDQRTANLERAAGVQQQRRERLW